MICLKFLLIVVFVGISIPESHAEQVNVKLVGGGSTNEGSVYVEREGNWGLVCDDNWNVQAGNVVCRQLGYKKASRVTSYNSFRAPYSDRIFLDDVSCAGREKNIGECKHREWLHSNCHAGEAAGVVCEGSNSAEAETEISSPVSRSRTSYTLPSTEELIARGRELLEARRTTVRRSRTRSSRPRVSISVDTDGPSAELTGLSDGPSAELTGLSGEIDFGSVSPEEEQTVNRLIDELEAESRNINSRGNARPSRVEIVGGRSASEGYVRVHLSNGKSGAVCSDNWGLSEATVTCKETGNKFADRATTSDFFRGKNEEKVFYEVHCDGHERSLADCEYKLISEDGVKCSRPGNVAGVVCTSAALPDLIPNIRALQTSIHIQEAPLSTLTCAMEERCLASSAYTQQSSAFSSIGRLGTYGSFDLGGWTHLTRRLLRFSSHIFNNGTADFRPNQHRSTWEWHSCHMHYHSMDTFSRYDILDSHGNRVAEGHKASFCLEDVECNYPHRKKYSCRGFGDQGISVGCADVYKSDIDCQWIDITDLSPGAYVFKLNVNPNKSVPELSFDNNAAICEMNYSGYNVKLNNCRVTRG